ncbi:MAG: AMP-binding protein [Acidimicrobiales bacterium]
MRSIEYFTSGTTSRPARASPAQLPGRPSRHDVLAFSQETCTGRSAHWVGQTCLNCFFAPLNAQACVFIYNYGRFSGPDVLDTLVTYGVNTLCAPPTVWRFLIQEDLAAYEVVLTELISAGEPLNPEVIEQVRTGWGLTIATAWPNRNHGPGRQYARQSGQSRIDGACPVPHRTPRRRRRPGRPELCVTLGVDRPVGLMTAYADDHEKTADVMRDGFYPRAFTDADGYITYVGRADDVFKASGYRISPFELESALIEHPAVAEAAIILRPMHSAAMCRRLVIWLQASPQRPKRRVISTFLRTNLSGYKRIRRQFADLPRISGKIHDGSS